MAVLRGRRFIPDESVEQYDHPPAGFVRYTDLLRRFGWTPPGITRVWPDVVADLKANKVVAVRKKQNWVRYLPVDTQIPLHPRLGRAATIPRPSAVVEPESAGSQSLKKTVHLPCSRVQQGNNSYYVVTVPASVLQSQHVIRRLDHDPSGVNRLLNQARCLDIAQAMVDSVPFPDSITVHIDSPRVRNGELAITSGTEMEIIDGQHRVVALSLLSEDELQRWSFTCHVYHNLDLRKKQALFFSQTEREGIAPQIKLSLQHKLGLFKTERQQTAYQMAIALNEDGRSPLADLINTTERLYARAGDKALKQRSSLPAGHYDIIGVYNIIQKALGKNSVLAGMAEDKVLNILIWTFRAAEATWKTTWTDELSSLRSLAGIATLVELHNEPLFLACLGGEYTYTNIQQVLKVGRRFRWNADSTREALANQLGRAHRRRGVDRASTALARNIHSKYRKAKA
jgi:DGQHR domain-containing protein